MQVIITDLNHEGKGITRIDNKVTFVKNALPGEIIDIKITNEKSKYNEAEIFSIIKPSETRVNPSCKYYNECGGCNLMHMSYESSLCFKKDKVKNILKRYSNLDIELDIVPSINIFNYRNKITLHKVNKRLGFMKENTNEVIPIKECLIADNKINKVNKRLGFMKENTNEVIPIEECLIADNKINEVINSLNINKNELVIRTNGKDIIYNEKDFIIMSINDYKYRIDIKSFFQVNSYICGEIFNYILKFIDKDSVVLDLYSGVGTLSIVASKIAKKVYSIEMNKYSHNNAIYNLRLNNVSNVSLINGKVENEIFKINDNIDLIITDPPRSGMDKVSIEVIKKILPKKILYMSCNPITLARDLNLLKDLYDLESIKLFDMFPNTYHVESVCLLNLK